MYKVIRNELNDNGFNQVFILGTYETRDEAFQKWASIQNKTGCEVIND